MPIATSASRSRTELSPYRLPHDSEIPLRTFSRSRIERKAARHNPPVFQVSLPTILIKQEQDLHCMRNRSQLNPTNHDPISQTTLRRSIVPRCFAASSRDCELSR